MIFRNLIFEPEVVKQRLRAGMVSHHEQQASKWNGEQQHRVLWPAYNPNLAPPQASTEGLFQQTRLCLLKNLGSRHAFCRFWSPGYSLFSFFRPGSCSCNLRGWLTAEDSHQPFQVLRRGRQVELLAHEAHPAQPQSAESDVILQLCKECFHFPPRPLRDRERGCLGQGVGTLSRWLT